MFHLRNPTIFCKDGTTLSVQASESHYCTPRNNDGPWTNMEVGFPSIQVPDTWLPFADGDGITHTDVYGWVPIEMIEDFINQHGGIDFKTFKR